MMTLVGKPIPTSVINQIELYLADAAKLAVGDLYKIYSGPGVPKKYRRDGRNILQGHSYKGRYGKVREVVGIGDEYIPTRNMGGCWNKKHPSDTGLRYKEENGTEKNIAMSSFKAWVFWVKP